MSALASPSPGILTAPPDQVAPGTRWVAPALVAVALIVWLASVAVFITHPLAELPLYFAKRYLVLDAT